MTMSICTRPDRSTIQGPRSPGELEGFNAERNVTGTTGRLPLSGTRVVRVKVTHTFVP